MVKEQLPQIDVRDLPELERLAEQVRRTNTPTLLTRDDEVLVRVLPEKTHRPATRRRTGARTTKPDDSLLRLIGIASGPDDGVHDTAAHHDMYLANAYAPTHE